MSIRITTTKGAGVGRIKVLVHGPPGIGKTRLAATTGDLPGTLILSAEGGLLSLREHDIRQIEVGAGHEAWGRIEAAVDAILSGAIPDVRWLVVDSISEVAEALLASEKGKTVDPRRAYGELGDKIPALIRKLRDVPANVVMIAKQSRFEADGQPPLYGPAMPGKQLTGALAYLFDEVFAMQLVEVAADDGTTAVKRAFVTQRTLTHEAKDRSGALKPMEPARLDKIAHKIASPTTGIAPTAEKV